MTAQEGSLVGQTLGVYRLRSLLGVGGMAEVYLAEDPSLRRDIAVKVLPRSLAMDPGYVERFRNEAQRVASLSHPHITPVYTFGEERGLLYLVMPRLKESLRERMEHGGILPVSEAARLTNQIAAALHIAHEHGIVHRDVKPENILLDETGKAMLTDFGIARELTALRESGAARTLAATGLPVGTPEYMAPEQLRGQAATEQVDVYALGVVLYEMLTAHVPHDATTPYEVATAVLRDPLKPPSYYNPNITPEIEQVILQSMEKDPADRFKDMKEFAMALRGAVMGQSQPVNSGALRWTQYAAPGTSRAPGAAAGVAGAMSSSRQPKGVAAASSSLILAPQIPLDETSRRPTITHSDALAQRYAEDTAAFTKRAAKRRSTLIVMAAATVALIALVATGLTVSHAMGLFSNSVDTPHIVARPTSTPAPTWTPLPTATPQPTATPYYVYITPTAAPPKPLSFSSSTVTLQNYSGACYTTTPLVISNLDSTTVTWKWTASNPSLSGMGFGWQLNGSGFHSGLPADSQGIPAYEGSTLHSDSLTLMANCGAFSKSAPYTVTMTDSLGRSYTLKLTYNG